MCGQWPKLRLPCALSIRTIRKFASAGLRTYSPQRRINRLGQSRQFAYLSTLFKPGIVQADPEAALLLNLTEYMEIEEAIVSFV